MNVWGKARDIEDLSLGFSTLDDLLAAAAKQQGRSAIPDSRPDKGKIIAPTTSNSRKSACRRFTLAKANLLSPVPRRLNSVPTNLTRQITTRSPTKFIPIGTSLAVCKMFNFYSKLVTK